MCVLASNLCISCIKTSIPIEFLVVVFLCVCLCVWIPWWVFHYYYVNAAKVSRLYRNWRSTFSVPGVNNLFGLIIFGYSNYTKQILEGLMYLHSKNVVHRDIKGIFMNVERIANILKMSWCMCESNIVTIRSKSRGIRGNMNMY